MGLKVFTGPYLNAVFNTATCDTLRAKNLAFLPVKNRFGLDVHEYRDEETAWGSLRIKGRVKKPAVELCRCEGPRPPLEGQWSSDSSARWL